MSTYTKDLHQVVFCGKYRQPFLTKENQDDVFRYIAGVLKKNKCYVYIVGGHKNHVHLVFDLHPTVALAFLVKDIKRAVETFIKRERGYRVFSGWQVGYGSFTYTPSVKDELVRYVMNQENHHAEMDYEEELINLLEENNIPYERKYLFV